MIRKMDEMEKEHSLKSVRVAYIYIIAFTLIALIVDGIKNQELSITSNMFILLVSQSLILCISHFYFKAKVDDSQGKKGLKFVLIASVIGFILGYLLMEFSV